MKTLIAIPCGDFCHTDFLRALLSLEVTGQIQYTFAQGSLIYDARNQLAGVAMDGGFDRLLWLDSDIVFPPDLLRVFNADLDEGRDIVAGLYVSRKKPITPVVYERCYYTQEDRWPTPHVDAFKAWPNEPFKCAAFGFGAVLMKTELLRKVHERFSLPFTPTAGFGEDISFCLRASELGAELWCDPRVPLAHIGLAAYTPGMLTKEATA